MSTLEIITKYREGFLNGLLVTFQLCLIIWISGVLFGGLLGVLGAKKPKYIGFFTRIFSFVLSGIPVLVFLFWLHYPFQSILNVVINPFVTASVALSIINIFSVADIVRNALNEIPTQYREAALVCGVSTNQRLWKIEIPIIFRNVLPTLLITQVNMLHLTLFGSLISVEEIFRVCQQVNSQIYQPVEIYTALGLFFLLICLPINGFALWLKNKFSRNFSEK
jgi:polar amino acid transport system permease protein